MMFANHNPTKNPMVEIRVHRLDYLQTLEYLRGLLSLSRREYFPAMVEDQEPIVIGPALVGKDTKALLKRKSSLYNDLYCALDQGKSSLGGIFRKIEKVENSLRSFKLFLMEKGEGEGEGEGEEREYQHGRWYTCQYESDGLTREDLDDLNRFENLATAHKEEQRGFVSVPISELWSENGRGNRRFSDDEAKHVAFYKWKREKRVEKIQQWIESASKKALVKGLKRLKERYSESVKTCVKINCFTECFLKKEQYQSLKRAIVEELNK